MTRGVPRDLAWGVPGLLARRPEAFVLLAVPVVLLLLPGHTPFGIYGVGLVYGAALALQATGIVLVFRSNRFLNFAQLQVGAVGGTLFAVLVNARPVYRGVHALCPPCLERVTPAEVTVNYWVSLALALAASVLLSWLLYVAVIRSLDRAPRLVATVASLFLVTLLAGLQRGAVQVLSTPRQQLLGGVTNAVPPPVRLHLDAGGARFGLPAFLLVGVAVVGLLAIGLYLRRSATGTVIRAAAESAGRAQTLGVDVVKVTGRVWILVGALSGAAGIIGAMAAPAGDGTGAGTDLVPVLVVVVIARLVSLPMVAAAALALGVLTPAVAYSLHSTGGLTGVLVVVVAGMLLLQRRDAGRVDTDTSASLAGRQARPVPRELRDLPGVQRARRGGALLLVGVLGAAPFILSPSQTSTVTTTLLFAVVGMSLLVLTGWAGLVSLGQVGFAAVGAWAAASSGLPFLLAVPLGVLAGAAVALLVGLPALRLRPLTLAISTLVFASAVPAVLLSQDALGGALPAELRRPLILGVNLDSPRSFYYLALVVLAAVVAAVAGLRRSRTARVLLAARDNEPAAQSFGISVLRARLQVFAMAGGVAAMAGALFAYQQAGVRAESFGAGASLQTFAFTVIGGLGTILGPLVGFAVLLALTLSKLDPTVSALLTGTIGLGLLLLAPGGLAQLLLSLRDGLLRRVARRNGIVVPSLERGRLPGSDVAPILPKTRPGGGTAFVPRRYALSGHWTAQARRQEAGRR